MNRNGFFEDFRAVFCPEFRGAKWQFLAGDGSDSGSQRNVALPRRLMETCVDTSAPCE
jgi:hypothetical protein